MKTPVLEIRIGDNRITAQYIQNIDFSSPFISI